MTTTQTDAERLREKTAWRVEVARRDAADVSATIQAGKRVLQARTEDLRNHVQFLANEVERLSAAIDAAVAAEREECAKVADGIEAALRFCDGMPSFQSVTASRVAVAIRARTPSSTPTDRHPYDDEA